MNKTIVAFLSAGALVVVASSAQAHDRCEQDDHVSQVDRYSGADVIHYDHHHYGYDQDGREAVIHHDHHYVMPNDDYAPRRSEHRRGNFFGFFFGR